ncbi:strawberry notch-like NTP hydrolase domain-containing protein [Paracoccus sp. FO-3]|uniref:strawberry notch-like NTP hydrolase domain-containing protein n=1 Tax=Paracoccus sp. FO-3 TaxID=1335059 RepID=UPI00112E3ED9|nr:strawberry notch family protein [Paracoccus sp. FO-3]
MNAISTAAARSAVPAPAQLAARPAAAVLAAAQLLLPMLERGDRVDAPALRAAMETAFGASDTSGAWDWKLAYEACEATTVLFLRKYGPALQHRAGSMPDMLPLLTRIMGLLPSQTRRSEEMQTWQQFSTPIPLGLAAVTAAAITPGDVVLEPSAGTGLMAILAEIAGGQLMLNELAETRADLLVALFPGASATRFDAAQIHDHLPVDLVPSVVLMNPPFSAMANVQGRVADTTFRHVASALTRLAPGGRLVAITGAGFAPESPAWRDAFARLQERGRVRFTAPIAGAVYARHGTTFPTRLTVIDRIPTEDPARLPASLPIAGDVETLMGLITDHVPPRSPVEHPALPAAPTRRAAARLAARKRAPQPRPVAAGAPCEESRELVYETRDWSPAEGARLTEAIYEEYGLQTIRIPGARPHPTKLVQSAAMASVAPPKPSYRPLLPGNIHELLSEAQLETVIYAGEAHAEHLPGQWQVDETFDVVTLAREEVAGSVRFRRGFMIGDGTGVGKGRQAASIILDNWLRGRRKAVWISKSDKLIEDAQRDWSALGMERLLVTPLSRFPQGKEIMLPEGILFTTYATLRSDDRGGKKSRVKQIVDWLGSDFDGVIVFDEAHAMANAAGGKGERGDVSPSQQGRAGLRLQHALPDARILYVSATGATTVENLAYAQRLGLWGGEDFPFASRSEFVSAIEDGGVAAMEVLARDLRALGLYTARSLSFDGVEYDLVEHRLTPEQIRIYDAYASGFEVIHGHLDKAMEAANITGSSGTLNRQARSAARSAFESTKQRFFGHLLTSMKTPTLIQRIEEDLAAGHAAVIQIVSTGEALMERRLAELPTEEWNDVRIDITPREACLGYLQHSFPTQLYEPYTDADGNMFSRPVMRDGQPVESREAVARRDELIAHLASLPAVPGALDQVVQHFGTDMVAEVTGRSRRIIRKGERLVVQNRSGSANLSETHAFMDDRKRVLVFSDAGGTGRSYHAELSGKNTRLRVHYLLEPGWKADTAIQGLGRTHRTNQAQPPLFRPVATDVKAEKRFLSTIARRLDTLGAITRGQRQTGGQGLFRPEDNLESHYARDALRQLYILLVRGKVEGCSLERFEAATGLKLMDANGVKDDLPPITTFLNRLLALTIEMQGILFTAFEALLTAKIEGAIAAGVYDMGLETLSAESFAVTGREVIHTHARTGAETRLLTIRQRERNTPLPLAEALDWLGQEPKARLLVNERSGRAAVEIPATSIMLDDGEIIRRVRLIRPMEGFNIAASRLAESHWAPADGAAFRTAWQGEIAEVPEFTESTLHMVTGLLLPIWKRLPEDSTRIYRLQTDEGERIIGRRVSPAWAANATTTGITALSPEQAHAALTEGRTILDLEEGLQLRRSRVMGAWRIELSGFDDRMRQQLTAFGLFHEIISWKLRMFVPADASGIPVLARILERWPVRRVSEREAA